MSTFNPYNNNNPSEKDYNDTFANDPNKSTQSQDDVKDVKQSLHDFENSNQDNQDKNDSSLAEKEQDPQSSFINNFTESDKPKKGKFWTRRKVTASGIGVGGLGILIFSIMSGFIPFGGLLINLAEVSKMNLDTRDTILSKRIYKVLDAKLAGNITSGSCQGVKIACKFSKPSNAFLSRIGDFGIEALDKDGNPIEKTKVGFPNTRPAQYRYIKANKETLVVSANQFTKTLRNEPEFRNAFTKAYDMRYWGYASSAMKKLFYKKYGVDRSGKTTNSIDPEKPQESIKAIADGADKDNPLKTVPDDPDKKNQAVKDAIGDAVEKEAMKTAKRIGKTGGDPILAAGTIGCLAINTAPFVTNISRMYQIKQVVSVAANTTLVASDMTKAGDMTPELMNSIATLVTASSIKPDGTNTKAAMDSFGVKSVLHGDSNSTDPSYKKFIPGASLSNSLGGINSFATNPATKTTCDVINSPAAFLAVSTIEGVVSATGVGAIVVGALKGLGKAGSIVITSNIVMDKLKELGVVDTVVGTILDSIPPEVVASLLANDEIGNATEEDYGNVIGSGLRFFYSSATLSTGGLPMKQSQISAFDKARTEVIAQYAEQDRVGRNPFDISSPNTFLGSMVSDFARNAFSSDNIGATILSSIGYFARAPLTLLSPNSFAIASNFEEQCSHGEEFGVDNTMGVGPFSELCAGLPVEYLDTPTSTVFSSVQGMINETTGEVKDDSQLGLDYADCSDGSLLNANGCAIDPAREGDNERAIRQLYHFDLEINNVLDGEVKQASGSLVGRPDGAIDLYKGWTLAPGVDFTQYPCDPRTTDAGVSTIQNGSAPGATVRLCALGGQDWSGGSTDNGANLLASVITTNALNMFEAARRDGLDLHVNDGFRYYNAYTSIHTTGLAMDIGVTGGNTICRSGADSISGFGSPENAEVQCARIGGAEYASYKWLQAHAAEYGFYNYEVEPWHWSASGK